MQLSNRFVKIMIFVLAGRITVHAEGRIEIPLGLQSEPAMDSFLPYYPAARPKIALALSGGGMRGLAQIGVLKAFERHGLPVDGIAGVSMGAVIGGLYAAGYSAMQLDSIARGVEWNEILQDAPSRQTLLMTQKESNPRHLLQFRLQRGMINFKTAISGGQKLNELLNDLVWHAPLPVTRNFSELSIPYSAVCADLLTGEKVVIRSGALVEAMRASMAIPLLFTPVESEGRWLVDGGLLQNLPVCEARATGCDLVVAVNTTSPLRRPGHLKAPWEIADQVTTIMGRSRIAEQLEQADVRIRPDLDDMTNTNTSRIDAILRAGEAAAEAVIPRLDSLLSDPDQTEATREHWIRQIETENHRRLPVDRWRTDLDNEVPGRISENRIRWAAHQMLQTGQATHIKADLDTVRGLLRFMIEETPVIREIKFWGNLVFPDSILMRDLQTRPGDQIQLHIGKQDLRRVLKRYHRAGYSLTRIEKVWVVGSTLHVILDEGRIRQIDISGNVVSLPFVIRRDLALKPGDFFNVTGISQTLQDLYSTRYFKEAGFNIAPIQDGYRLNLHVSEHLFTLARIGLRYDMERRMKGFLEIARDNVLGLGAEGSAAGHLGKREKWIDFNLHADRIYTTHFTGSGRLMYGKSEYTYYKDLKSVGGYTFACLRSSLDFGRQIQRLGLLSLRLQTENYHITPLHDDVPLRNEKMIIQSILLKSVVDSRDRIPFPKRGKYHHFEYETAMGMFGSKVHYAKISSLMESYYPLRNGLNFHPRIYWATADLTTPFTKQVVIGGLDSFMGLPERALIGRRCLLLNTALRLRLPWPRLIESYLSVRYDFGGVWKHYSKIQSEDFKHGIGAILGLRTPLGPIYVGAGRMSDGMNQFYFSAGYRF